MIPFAGVFEGFYIIPGMDKWVQDLEENGMIPELKEHQSVFGPSLGRIY